MHMTTGHTDLLGVNYGLTSGGSVSMFEDNICLSQSFPQCVIVAK